MLAIKQSGELLLELITEILDYSRLENGHVELESAPFDPEATMQSVAELLSPRARDKSLEIAVSVRGDAPARVIGDDGRLRQILFNLAGNAVKFTETGGVVIEMAPRPSGRLRFNIRDTGPGVAPEKQALIFEEFTQADAGVARRHGGAGLGLAIVKKLALAMGGEVGLVSRPGFGASFWVELPLASTPSEEPLPSLTGVRICVVSRSLLLTQTLRAVAISLNATPVERGAYADVVLLDWHEGIDGEEIDALRRNSRALIALAPQERRQIIDACRAAGIEHYTLKPVRRASLVERVRAALGDEPAAPRAPARTEQAPTQQPLLGLRVLLAEDNPINALLARTLLTRAGCSVTTAQDGEEAVTVASAAAFDLILLDIRMPRLDGFEAAERIRAGGGLSAAAPMVALTADAGDEERAHAAKAGMDDFITKPIDANRLLQVAARFTQRPNPATFAGK
jgi:CheY-like chemotaxis protein